MAEIENVLGNIDSLPELSFCIIQYFEDGKDERKILSYFKNRLNRNLDENDYTVQLLLTTLERFSEDVIDENMLIWTELVLKQEPGDFSANFDFLTYAVKYCGRSHDRYRVAVSGLIPAILKKCFLLKKPTTEINRLTLLETCFSNFSSPCKPFKAKAETLILRYLDTQSGQTSIGNQAAKCFVAIQQCGPVGSTASSLTNREAWTNAFNILCETIRNVNDHTLSTGYTVVNTMATYPLEPLPENCNVYNSLKIAGNRLHWLTRFLTEMLRSSSRFPKIFRPQVMLDVLDNALHNNNAVHQVVILRSIKIDYQKNLFKLFRIFVLVMRGNLIPFLDGLLRSLIAKLNEARHPHYNNSSDYKCALYQLLATIIQVVGNNIGATYQEKLLNILVDEITPINQTIKLTIPSSLKNVSSRKRQKLANDQTIANSEAKTKSYGNSAGMSIVKEKIYSAALTCLKECMSHVSLSLKPELEKKLYSTILTVTKSIEDGEILFPYTNPSTHHLIYDLLCKCSNQNRPPPLPYLVSALNAGCSNNHHQVQQTSSKGLKHLSNFCQPTQPPLANNSSTTTAAIDNVRTVFSMTDDDLAIQVTPNDKTTMFADANDGNSSDEISEDIYLGRVKGIVEETMEFKTSNNDELADSGKGKTTSILSDSSDVIESSQTISPPIGSSNAGYEADSELNSSIALDDMLASLVP